MHLIRLQIPHWELILWGHILNRFPQECLHRPLPASQENSQPRTALNRNSYNQTGRGNSIPNSRDGGFVVSNYTRKFPPTHCKPSVRQDVSPVCVSNTSISRASFPSLSILDVLDWRGNSDLTPFPCLGPRLCLLSLRIWPIKTQETGTEFYQLLKGKHQL